MSEYVQKVVLQAVDKQSNIINLAAKNTKKSFKQMKASSKEVTKSMADVRQSFISLKTVVTGVAAYASAKLVSSFISAGSQVEDLTTQFKVLLGSVEGAKERMVDLEKFAQTTPFQLTEIGQASKVLQTLTKGALAHGSGLALVGDTAAATGAEFSNLALHVGRAYDGLRNNRPVGESMMRLQELGIISGGVRAEIENLTKQGLGVQAWEVLKTQLEKNKGGMEELSKTVTGLTSTIKDQLQSAMRGVLDSGVWDKFRSLLGSVVQKMNELIDQGVFKKIGAGFVSLLENIDKVTIIGATFLSIFAVTKLAAIATAVATFTAQLVTANPALAAMTATMIAFEIVIAKINDHADKLAGKDFLTSEKDVAKTKNALITIKELSAEVDTLKSKRNVMGGFGGLTTSGISEAEKLKLQKFDNAVKIARENFGSSFDPKRANIPQLIKGLGATQQKLSESAKVAKELKKELAVEDAPATKTSKAKKGTSVDFSEIAAQEKLNREMLLLEINEMTITAQSDSQERELALLEIKFQREMAMEARTLDWKKARKLQHQSEISAVDKKWSKTKQKQAKDDEKLELAKKQLAVKNAQSIASNYINAAQAIFGENKKFALLNKGLAIGESIVNTWVAVSKSLPNIPLAASIGVLGAASTAKIASTNFTEGGIVPGNSMSGDKITAGLNSREMVLNTRQQDQLFKLLNGGLSGGGSITNQIYYQPQNNFGGGENIIDQLKQDPDQFVDFFEKTLENRGYQVS